MSKRLAELLTRNQETGTRPVCTAGSAGVFRGPGRLALGPSGRILCAGGVKLLLWWLGTPLPRTLPTFFLTSPPSPAIMDPAIKSIWDDLNAKTHTEQAVWFMNGFWVGSMVGAVPENRQGALSWAFFPLLPIDRIPRLSSPGFVVPASSPGWEPSFAVDLPVATRVSLPSIHCTAAHPTARAR